uniref:Uncharacterized protein n=1 Tax=Aegilops tauschii TaxID=37682 RepID=R7WDN4_AEGTA
MGVKCCGKKFGVATDPGDAGRTAAASPGAQQTTRSNGALRRTAMADTAGPPAGGGV